MLSYVCACIEAGEGVLSHEDTYHSDISFARADTPAGISGIIQKLSEHKAARPKFGGGGENGNDHGEGPNRMPPNGNIVKVFEKVNTESVDQAYVYVCLVHSMIRRSIHTLANQDSCIHPNRCLLVWDETSVNGSGGGDERCASKAMGLSAPHDTPDIFGKEKPNSGGHGDLTEEIEPTTDP